ncbi:MAG: Ubiquinone biosynthesis protein coq9, mitochondrial, partial [Thelocarpon superellum]
MSVKVSRLAPRLRHPRRLSPHAYHQWRRLYHSDEHDAPPPFNASEEAILSASMSHVPSHGFSTTALTLGAQDAGYRAVSVNLFPRGAFDLIHYHLVTQRLSLRDRVQFASTLDGEAGGNSGSPELGRGVGAKIRALALARLMANSPTIHRWQETHMHMHAYVQPHPPTIDSKDTNDSIMKQALAIMAQPSHISSSMAELARLSDEMWFLAGDVGVDGSWYTKRASLAAVYSSAELFMTQDA